MSPAGRDGDIGVNSDVSVGATDTDLLAVVAASCKATYVETEELLADVCMGLGTTAAALVAEETTGLAMAELETTELVAMVIEAVLVGITVEAGEPPAEADVVAKTAVRAGGAVDMTARAPVEVGARDEAVFS